MYAFDLLGLVEQRGLGFQTIKTLPEIHGLPLPIVTYEDPYMDFKFPRSGDALKLVSKQEGIGSLSKAELKGYDWIRTQPEVATKDYAVKMNVVQRTASRHLAKMLEFGLILTNGESSTSPSLKHFAIE
jgi:predicted HTH transcriptional regulator